MKEAKRKELGFHKPLLAVSSMDLRLRNDLPLQASTLERINEIEQKKEKQKSKIQ